MSDDLRIIISASLDSKKSIENINEVVKKIESNPQLQKIRIQVDIDEKISKTLRDFNSNFKSLSKASESTNNKIKETTNQIKDQTKEIKNATNAQTKWRIEQQKTSQVTGNGVTTYGNNLNNDKQVVSTNKDGSVRDVLDISNVLKNEKDYNKEFEKLLKEEEALDRAHYMALKDNKAKIDAIDKLHYQALQENSKRYVSDLKKLFDDAEKLDRDHFRAITENNKRNEDMEKLHFLALQKNRQRDIDQRQIYAAQLAKIDDAIRRFGSDSNANKELNNLRNDFLGLQGNNKGVEYINDFKNKMKDVDVNLKKITSTVDTSGSHIDKLSQSFQTAISKTLIWSSTMGLLYGSLHSVQSAIDTIITTNSQLIEMARVLPAQTDLGAILESNIGLAKELGQSLQTVNDAYSGFARQGFSDEQAKALTKTAIIASNISDLTLDESTSTLTSALAVFNIEASKSIDIVNALNEVDNNFAVTTKDLSAALNKSASTGKAFGVTLEEQLGDVAAIVEVTRASGEEVGNSLKTIYSRITTNGSAIKALNSIGIEMKNLDGSAKSATQILTEMHTRFQTLSESEKRNVAVKTAGVYQLNKLLALMGNWDTKLEATTAATNSFGSALKENAVYQTSLEARISKMKTAFTELALSVGDAVLSDSIILITESLKTMADTFNTVVGHIGVLPVAFGVIGTSAALLNKNFRTAAISVATLGNGMKSLGVSTEMAKVSLRGLMASTGVGVALMAVGFAVEFLVGKMADAKQKSEALETQNKTIVESYTTQRDKINELLDVYQQLNSETANGNVFADVKQEEKYYQITNQLATLLPNVVERIDEKGRAHLLSGDALSKEIEFTKELTARTLELQEIQALQAYSDNQKNRENLISDIDKLQNKIKSTEDAAKDYKEALDILSKGTDQNILDKYGFEDEIQLQDAYKESETSLREYKLELVQTRNELELNSKGSKEYFMSLIDSAASLEHVSFGDTLREQLKNVVSSMDLTNLTSDKLSESAYSIVDSFKQSGSSSEVFLGKLKGLSISTKDTANAVDVAVKALTSAKPAMEEIGDETNSTEDEMKTLEDTVRNAASSLAELNQIVKDTSDGQSLNAKTVSELIDQYPELIDKIQVTADGYRIEGDALEELRQLKIESMIDAKRAEMGITEEVYNQLSNRLSAYGMEIQMIQDVATAREMAAKIASDSKSQSDEPLLMGGAYVGLQKLTSDAEQTVSQVYELGKFKENFEKKYRSIISNPSFGVSSDKEKKPKASKDDPSFQSATDAKIASINSQAEAQQKLNDKIKEEADSYTSDNNYAAAIKATTRLISGQNSEIDKLTKANVKLAAQRKKIQDANSKYDMSSWVDANGEATESFIKLYNSLGSGKAQESLQSLFDQYQKYTMAIRENSSAIQENIKDRNQSQKDLDALKVDNTNAYLEKITAPLDVYDQKIDESNKRLSLYTQGTAEYNAEQTKQVSLLKEKGEYLAKEIQWVEGRLKQGDLTVEQEAALNAWLIQNKSALLDNATATKELNTSRAEAYKQWSESVKSAAQDALETLQDFYKQQGESEKKALDDQLDAYEKYIDDRKKALSRENETNDFEKDRAKLQQEASALQQKISTLKLDSSWKATSQREELEKELSDKLTEISELQDSRERKLREDNFDDLLDMQRAQTEAAKDAVDQKWQSELEKDKYYSSLKESILQGNVNNMQSTLEAFSKNTQSYMDAIGKSIDLNVIDKLNAIQNIKDVANTAANLGSNPSSTSPSSDPYYEQEKKDWQEYLNNKKKAEAMGANKGAEYQNLQSRNSELRKKYGFIDGSYAFLKGLNLFSADTGGLTPAWGSGGKLLLAHEKELILNKQDTSNILKVVDWTRDLFSNFKMPDLSKLIPQVAASPSTNSQQITFNVEVNASDRNAADKFIKTIKTHIKQNGI